MKINDRMMRAVIAIGATLKKDNLNDQADVLGNIGWFDSIWDHTCERGQDPECSAGVTFQDSSVRQLILGTSSFPIVEHILDGTKVYDSPGAVEAKTAYQYFHRLSDSSATAIDMDNLVPDGACLCGRSPWRLTFNARYQGLPGYGELRGGRDDAFYYDGLTTDPVQNNGYYADVLLGNKKKDFAALPTTTSHTVPQLAYVHFDYEGDALLDGIELLCQLADKPRTCTPPVIASVADLPRARDFMDCIAEQTRGVSSRTVLSNFPIEAFDPLRRDSAIGSFPAAGGEQGVEISELRSALTGLVDVPLLIAGEISKFGHQLEGVYDTIESAGLSDQLADVQLESTMANQMAACVGSAGLGSLTSLASVATCANSLAQAGFAREINSLTKQKVVIDKNIALSQFGQQFSDTSTNMARYAVRLTDAVETVDRELAKIELQKNKAKLALSRALQVHTFHSHFQDRINAVLLARFQTASQRYETAYDTARRMAFLAKRSIEMRLGIKLSQITQDLPLVTAPANWESTVCTSTGVNFDKIAESTGTQFADSFIGDYVDKLANVVESYRLVNNFHEGADTSVISIRDDVQNIRAVCDVEVSNQLFNAGQFDVPSVGDVPGWDRLGCAMQTGDDGIARPVVNCIGTFPVDERPITSAQQEFSNVRSYRIRFGDGAGCADSTTCGYQTGAELVQKVHLTAGRYRESVYVKDLGGYTDLGLVQQGGTNSVQVVGSGTILGPTTSPWARQFVVFDVDSSQDVSIGFSRPQGGPIAGEIVIGAPLLEAVTDLSNASKTDPPGAFSNTSSVRTVKLPLCEDTDGQTFRTKAWTRGNALLCDDGFSGNCIGSSAKSFGYWETTFNINQRDIEAGRILGNAGFARGNFNYRIDSLGVNFVGTGIRDCADSMTPSTCYSAGFVPYTLMHDGPYFVRNYQGQDFEAELFPGRIENARGLATERYFTNPLSSTDQGLIKEFQRLELQGRPMDGNFVLRVWDTPGLNFDAIKDLQIILNYRYWTRFN